MKSIEQIKATLTERGITEIYAYSRKSREIDIEGLQKHRDIMGSFAENLGLPIYYSDEAESSEHLNRPVLNVIREDIKKKKIRCLMVYRIDRLSRKVTDTERLIKEFNFNDLVLLEANREQIVDFNEILSIKLEAMMSDLYQEQAKLVLSAGRKKTVGLYGNHLGETPIGYNYNPSTKKLEPNEQAWIVKSIFQMYIDGYSTHSIAVKLNQQGSKTKTGGEFKGKGVWFILNSERYIGTQTYGRQEWYKDGEGKSHSKNRPRKDWVIYENAHEAIIDRNTFEQVGKMMEDSREVPTGARKHKHPLTQVVKCEKCGRYMSMITRAYPNKSVVMVRSCCNKDYTTGTICGNKGLPSDDVFDYVKKQIWEVVRPTILRVSRDLAKGKNFSNSETEPSELKQLVKQKAQLNKQMDNLIDLQMEMGKAERLVTKMKQVEAQLKNLQERIQILEEINDVTDGYDWVENYLVQSKELVDMPFSMNSMSDEDKNIFVRKYVESVYVLDGDITEIKFSQNIERLLSL